MAHGVILVFLICGICWVSFLLFTLVFRADDDIFNFVYIGNLALCRFHSNHIALRKPILAVYPGLSFLL